MASLANLPDAGERLLAAFVDQLEVQGVDVPDRRYRAPGTMIVWDGEQLTVALVTIDQGQPGMVLAQSMVASARVMFAQFSVNLVRVVASLDGEKPFGGGAVPGGDTMDVDGAASMADASALITAANQIHALDSNSLGQKYGLVMPGESFVVGPLQPLGPEGGLAGHRLLVSLAVD